jgi:membrane-associated phospholipid phosphatase
MKLPRLIRSFFLSFVFFFGSAQNLDIEILKTINGQPLPAWDKAMRNLSKSVYVLEPVVPIGITLHGYFTKDKELMLDGLKSAISLCGALAISTAVKYSVDRLRPYEKYPGEIDVRDSPHTSSFPSGHTTAAFATATSISLTYRKWYVTVPAYAYAGMVAYARMRLGVHYPTDVLGGMLLGTGSALLTWHLDKKLRGKRKKSIVESL